MAPNVSLSAQGDSVTCTRSGRKPVSVTLVTYENGSISDGLAEYSPEPAPEPKLVATVSPVQSKVVELVRSRDIVLFSGNIGCPQCKNMFVATISPGEANAVITGVSTIACSQGD